MTQMADVPPPRNGASHLNDPYETDVPLPEIAAILGIICYIKDGME